MSADQCRSSHSWMLCVSVCELGSAPVQTTGEGHLHRGKCDGPWYTCRKVSVQSWVTSTFQEKYGALQAVLCIWALHPDRNIWMNWSISKIWNVLLQSTKLSLLWHPNLQSVFFNSPCTKPLKIIMIGRDSKHTPIRLFWHCQKPLLDNRNTCFLCWVSQVNLTGNNIIDRQISSFVFGVTVLLWARPDKHVESKDSKHPLHPFDFVYILSWTMKLHLFPMLSCTLLNLTLSPLRMVGALVLVVAWKATEKKPAQKTAKVEFLNFKQEKSVPFSWEVFHVFKKGTGVVTLMLQHWLILNDEPLENSMPYWFVESSYILDLWLLCSAGVSTIHFSGSNLASHKKMPAQDGKI